MYQTRLFERMGNKISLTDAGRLLLEHCEKILEEYGRLEYEMNLLRNEHIGKLRLGASTTPICASSIVGTLYREIPTSLSVFI